jgi:hypothetical protein
MRQRARAANEGRERTMEDDPNGRMKAAREAMGVTDKELMTLGRGKNVQRPRLALERIPFSRNHIRHS